MRGQLAGLLCLIVCCISCSKNASNNPREIFFLVNNLSTNQVSEVANILRWDNLSDDILGYEIFRKTGNKPYQLIANLDAPASRYLDSGLNQADQNYSYGIKANSPTIEQPMLTINCPPQEPVTEPYQHKIYTPKDYELYPDSSFALLIFLHGAGERGTDINTVAVHGPLKLHNKGQDFPCLIAAPLCPANIYWDIENLERFLADIKDNYRIDPERIYLTGLSMGGYGTWIWGTEHPEHFAGLVPICGGGNPAKVSTVKDIPVWAFHGAKDLVIPLSQSEEMINALKDLGAEPKLTIYPEAGHDSWTAAYDNPDLWSWLFAQ